MRVKVGLTGRERQSKEEKKKKTLGAIIPGSVLAAAVLFLFIYYYFFNTFNMFLCAPCLGAISAYRLPMSSNLNFSINCDHL